jgi:hypothetical protein
MVQPAIVNKNTFWGVNMATSVKPDKWALFEPVPVNDEFNSGLASAQMVECDMCVLIFYNDHVPTIEFADVPGRKIVRRVFMPGPAIDRMIRILRHARGDRCN